MQQLQPLAPSSLEREESKLQQRVQQNDVNWMGVGEGSSISSGISLLAVVSS